MGGYPVPVSTAFLRGLWRQLAFSRQQWMCTVGNTFPVSFFGHFAKAVLVIQSGIRRWLTRRISTSYLPSATAVPLQPLPTATTSDPLDDSSYENGTVDLDNAEEFRFDVPGPLGFSTGPGFPVNHFCQSWVPRWRIGYSTWQYSL